MSEIKQINSTDATEFYNLDKFNRNKKLEFVATLKNDYVLKLKQGNFYKKYLVERFPILDWLPKYKLKTFLVADIFAGLIVGIMNIPQGMGYAMLATLDPVIGLYISFFPLLVYAFLGTSRQLAMGSIAIVSLLSGQCITGKFVYLTVI